MITAPRGTQDFLPEQMRDWQKLEEKIRSLCKAYGFGEIRTPIFEHTELFLRGIGETTDVVTKEMYTFEDRGGRSVTLRPENTASVVRAYLEHKLYGDQQLHKLFYSGPMFRHDRTQAGRYRQFHQFGIEVLGAKDPAVDAEIITLAMQLFKELGLEELRLHINSVGCPKCRPVYREKLIQFFKEREEHLCHDCKERLERNPLRVLDCKEESCKAASEGAPELTENLCDECADHFHRVQEYLTALHIPFEVDPRLVRGLDYYTNTAFEIMYAPLGAQSTICGGGRYDGLVEEMGGPATPGIGFAVGMERLLLTLKEQGLLPPAEETKPVYIAALGENAKKEAFVLQHAFRSQYIPCEIDVMDKSMKGQMKYANKIGAAYTLILGDDELAQGKVQVRNMETKEQELIALNSVVEYIKTHTEGKK